MTSEFYNNVNHIVTRIPIRKLNDPGFLKVPFGKANDLGILIDFRSEFQSKKQITLPIAYTFSYVLNWIHLYV